MKISLYRTYRPTKFSQIVGQEHIVKTLSNALVSGRVSHAYLFAGPRGTGKTTTARVLAAAINCKKRTEYSDKRIGKKSPIRHLPSAISSVEPCGKCPNCREITAGSSLDVIEIDAASNRGIEEIKDLRDKVRFTPGSSAYKVIIIDEVHMLTKEAFNALLKTLEEPPAHAIFIMATTEPHKVPATILSRSQRFDFHRASEKEIIKLLAKIAQKEKIKLDEDSTGLIARLSTGSFRDAISLLDQIVSIGGKKITLELVQTVLGIAEEKSSAKFINLLFQKDQKRAIEFINQLLNEGIDLEQFSLQLITYLRWLLLASFGQAESLVEVSAEQKKKLLEIAEKFTPTEIIKLLTLFIEVSHEIKATSSLPQLPLELAILEICKNNQQKDDQIKVAGSKKEDGQIIPTTDQEIDKDQWQKVLAEIKPVNSALYFILVETTVKLSKETVIFQVAFPFYRDRIFDKKNKVLIQDSLKKVLGKNLKIDCQISQKQDNLLDEALEVFESE